MALRKYCTFTDLEDRVIRVEIYDTAWSDPAEQFTAGKPGAVISHKSIGREPVAGIMGSEAVIRYKVEDVADLNFINTLVGSNEERFSILIKIDDVFEWGGFVIMDEVNWPAESYPYMVDLTAVDGITRLLDKDMDDAGTPYSGDYTDIEALVLMLGKVGTATLWDDSGASATWIRTSVEWNEKDYHPAAAADKDPLAYSRFNSSAWLKTKTTDDGLIQVAIDDEGNPMPKSVGECLMDLCRCWDARLYLSRGQWRFEQPNMMDTTTVYYRDYGINGTMSDYGQYNPRKSVDCDDIVQLDGSGYTFHAPVRKVVARRAHKSAINLFGTLGALPFDTNLSETTIMAAAVAGSGNRVRIKGKLFLEWEDYTTLNIGLFYGAAITVKLVSGSTYYLHGSNFNAISPIPANTVTYQQTVQPPAWIVGAGSYYFFNPNAYQVPSAGLTLDIDLTTPDIPDNGVLSVKIDFFIDSLGGAYNTNLPASYTYRFFDLQAIYRQTSNVNYTAYGVENTTDGSTPTGDTKIVDLGDLALGDGYLDEIGIGNHEASNNLSTWFKSGSWRIGTGTAYAMTELLCREVLARQKVAAKIMQASIYKGGIGMADVLSWDSAIWLCHGGTQDLHDAIFSGEWYVIAKTRTYLNTIVDDETVGDNVHDVIALPDDFRSFANRDAIMSIGAIATRGGSQLTASYDAGDTLTVLAVADLGFDLAIGAKIHVVNPYTGEFQTFTADDAYVSGGTSFAVDATAEIDLPVGSFVVVDVSAVMAIAGTELWTRTGTELTPTTSGDNVEVTSNANKGAIKGISTDYYGIHGASTNQYGVYGTGVIGVFGVGSTAGAVFDNNAGSANAYSTSVRLRSYVTGAPSNGIGTRIEFNVESSSGNTTAGYLGVKWTDVTFATRTSSLEISLYNSASIARKLAVAGTGQLTIDAYGDGTFTGTATYVLGVDADGNVIETALASGYWTRTGTELTPATSGDNVEVTVSGSTTAIAGISDSGLGISGVSTNNYAVYGVSTNSLGIYGVTNPSSTNSVAVAGGVNRRTTGTAANGIGVGFSLDVENGSGNQKGAVEFDAILTDVTNTTEDAKLVVKVRDNGTLTERLSLDNEGMLTVPKAHIGSTINYSEFDEYGTLRLFGAATVYDDQQVELGAVRLGSSAPTWTPYKGSEVLSFAKNLDNKIFFRCQLTHRYKIDSTVHFHIHYTVPDNNTGDVRWVLTYSWANIGQVFPSESTEPKVITVPASSLDKHMVEEIYSPVPSTTGGGFSSYLLCSLTRTGSHDDDTYDAAAYLLGIDFHVECDKLGTTDEYDDTEGTTTTTT